MRGRPFSFGVVRIRGSATEPSAVFASDVIEFVLPDFAAQRVAMHSKDLRGAGLIPVQFLQHAPDEFLLKLGDGLFEQNPTLHHESDQRFQLIFHVWRSALCWEEMSGDDGRSTGTQGCGWMSVPPSTPISV